MKNYLLATFIVLNASLFGALSPFAESVREIQKLLAEKELQELLGTRERVLSITKVEEGYGILTENYLLLAHVEYLPQGRPGPKKFQFHFEEPVSIQDLR